MRRYIIRITEDTLPIIAKLHGNPPDLALLAGYPEEDYYYEFREDDMTPEMTVVLMHKWTLFSHYPKADREALLQVVSV